MRISNGSATSSSAARRASEPDSTGSTVDESTNEKKKVPPRNLPLAQSENEKARELVTLDEKFLRDVATMPPAAASYVRRHPCLTPDAMAKWRAGVLPLDGGRRQTRLVASRPDDLSDPRGRRAGPRLGRPRSAVRGERSRLPRPRPRRTGEGKSPSEIPFPGRLPPRPVELFGQHSSRLSEPGLSRDGFEMRGHSDGRVQRRRSVSTRSGTNSCDHVERHHRTAGDESRTLGDGSLPTAGCQFFSTRTPKATPGRRRRS